MKQIRDYTFTRIPRPYFLWYSQELRPQNSDRSRDLSGRSMQKLRLPGVQG